MILYPLSCHYLSIPYPRLFCLVLLMARRTCQSQPRNVTKGPSNEKGVALQGSANMNTTLQCTVDVQDQTIGRIQNNLKGALPDTMSDSSDHLQ
jgi:hypothetical protein